jgi:phosphatidylglycerophosphatase C
MPKKSLRGRSRSNVTLDEQVEEAGIVAFDFDGTITVKDSFMAFLRWRVPTARFRAGMFRLAPASLAYLAHRDRGRIKAAAVREFLKGVPRSQLEAEARAFAQTTASRLLRPDALHTWNHWRQRRAKLVIVTASPTQVVAPFARGLGADALIGTELAFDDEDRVTGAFTGANCRGDEKVRRLREVFGPDVRLTAAYGDTGGDTAMLALADEQGYRVFVEKP